MIKEANSLKRCLAASGCSSGKNLTSPGRRLNARENLREVVETLEQTVNNALLKLIVQGEREVEFCVFFVTKELLGELAEKSCPNLLDAT